MVREFGTPNTQKCLRIGHRVPRRVAIALTALGLLATANPWSPDRAQADGATPPPQRLVAVQRVGTRLEIVKFEAPGDVALDHASAFLPTVGNGVETLLVERDVKMRSVGEPLEGHQWALTPASTSFRKAWNTTQGAGIKVAVIDSGVRKTHEDLAGAVLPGIDLVTGSGDGSNDQNGHGSHVAGIIASQVNGRGIVGAAPGVKILPVRVLDGSGSGYSSDVAAGIIWATDNGAKVINLSLGGNIPSQATQEAIQYAHANGALVLAAAGNAGQSGNAPLYPAAFAEPGAVGAINAAKQRAPFSNWGSYVDVVAPGDGIVSAWSSGDASYAWASGTSMATPYAAAAAALTFAVNPNATPAQVRKRLERTADDLGTPGRDDQFGHGLIDPANAAKVITPRGGAEGPGYLIVTSDGGVKGYGNVRSLGGVAGFPVGSPVAAAAMTPSGNGYWLVTKSGLVFGFGDAHVDGHARGKIGNESVVAMASSNSGRGYLLVTGRGRVLAFGDAVDLGDAPRGTPVRDIATTHGGRGYWLLASDGRALPFGAARYHVTMRGVSVGNGATSFALTSGGRGFWAVRRNGEIAAYGAEPFGNLATYSSSSSRYGTRLRTVDSREGYYVLTNDGLVYPFGTARNHGSSPRSGVTAVDLLVP